MGTECCYEVAQAAYIKLVLHALKHRASPVGGILVGRLPEDNASTVQIVDSIPLTHSQIGLLPSLELALIQVEEHFGAQGFSVVGYYHANERYDDAELGNAAKKIGDHICRYFPRAALLLLDNKRLEGLLKAKRWDLVVQLYTRDSSKSWQQAGTRDIAQGIRQDGSSQLTIKEPSANALLLDYISSEKWQDIVDFDDHLDDISKDWLNPDLFK